MANLADAYGLFVSCVRGCPVTRFGTRQWIGAERDSKNVIHWFPERIVALTHHEARRYRKEYDRLIRDGELKVHTAADWLAQIEAPQVKAHTGEAPAPDPSPEDSAT